MARLVLVRSAIRSLSLLIICAILNVCFSATADEHRLTFSEVREIKRICATLLGVPVGAREPWLRLLRYARTRDALDRVILICSAECEGSLQLVDGAEIRFTHPNTPKGWPGAGHDRIDSITFIHHGKTLLSLPRPKT